MNTNNIMKAPVLITKPFDRSFTFECKSESGFIFSYVQRTYDSLPTTWILEDV